MNEHVSNLRYIAVEVEDYDEEFADDIRAAAAYIERLEEVLRMVEDWNLDWADGLDSNVQKVKSAVRASLGTDSGEDGG